MFSLLRTAHREFIIICIKKQIFTERWFVAFFKSIGNFVKHLYTIILNIIFKNMSIKSCWNTNLRMVEFFHKQSYCVNAEKFRTYLVLTHWRKIITMMANIFLVHLSNKRWLHTSHCKHNWCPKYSQMKYAFVNGFAWSYRLYYILWMYVCLSSILVTLSFIRLPYVAMRVNMIGFKIFAHRLL